MGVTNRTVRIFQVPSNLTSASITETLQQVQYGVGASDRPNFVLDCTGMRSVGRIEASFLLNCLEQAMKHNGDLRLAKLEPRAKTDLNTVGIGHMFEVFSTTELAVASYQTRRTSMAPFNYNVANVFTSDTEIAA